VKRCARCKVDKPPDRFGARLAALDGLHPYCLTCAREANRATRERHKLRYNTERAARRVAVPELGEAHRARSRAWYHENIEAAKARSKRWRESNAEYVAARCAQWRDENRERVREMNREAHARAPEKTRARVSTRRARKAAAFVEAVEPRVVWQMHGGCCGICHEFVEYDGMHVDHVVPLSRGGTHGYVNVQPAHSFCNLSKGAKTNVH
jgi:5-methylcytosine-specific restriction endonuclease McrA